jgi:hypothetical protein
MKHINKLIGCICTILIFSSIIIGCSKQSNNYKSQIKNLKIENQQLQDRISKLEKSVNDYKTKELKQNDLLIAQAEIPDKVRFIEKENKLLSLPQDNSKTFRIIQTNTLVKVIDRALVNEQIWIYIEIPVYDTRANFKGWIKENDTMKYTEDKVHLVQSDVAIIEGAEIYQTILFKDIKTTTPKKLKKEDGGRLQEKKDSYCRISQAGGINIWVKESSVVYPAIE